MGKHTYTLIETTDYAWKLEYVSSRIITDNF